MFNFFSGKKRQKIAIISDVQGNFHALEAVFRDIRARNISEINVLGNIIGHCALGNKCIEFIRSTSASCTRGPLDVLVPIDGSTEDAALDAAIAYNHKSVLEDNRVWLGNLSVVQQCEGILFSFGSPMFPTVYSPLDRVSKVRDAFDFMRRERVRIAAVGMAIPCAYINGKTVEYSTSDEYPVGKGDSAIICVGPLGLPRNDNIQAKYSIYDVQSATIQHVCVDYDWKAAQGAIKEAGLPGIISYWIVGRFPNYADIADADEE